MLPGVQLGQRYIVDERLGTGDLGSIWNGHDTLLDRPVSVKMLHPDLAAHDEIRDRFRQSTLRLARIYHPGIVDVFDHIEEHTSDGTLLACQITERLDGEPLSRRLRAAGKLDSDQVLRLIRRAALALDAAHRGRAIHRNLKPGNILVRDDDAVTVIGFGFLDAHATPRATDPSQPSSSVAYAAPELFHNASATTSSDVYSLALISYECLTGTNPFDGETVSDIAAHHARLVPRPLEDVPETMRDAIEKALSKRPDDRHTSALEFGQEFCGQSIDEAATEIIAAVSEPEAHANLEPAPEPETEPETEPEAEAPPAAATTVALPRESSPRAAKGKTTAVLPTAPALPSRLRTQQGARRGKPYKYSAITAVAVVALMGTGLLAHFGLPVSAEQNDSANATSSASQSTEHADGNAAPPTESSSGTSSSSSSSSSPDATSPSSDPSQPSPSSDPSEPSSDPSTPQEQPVPSVIGMDEDSASSQLQAEGFGASVAFEGSGAIECSVHAQDPSGGTPAAPGTTVTIHVKKVDDELQCNQ